MPTKSMMQFRDNHFASTRRDSQIAMTTFRRNGRTLGMASGKPLRRRQTMNWKTWMLWGACAIALAAETGAELYQKALVKERGAGNLEDAIQLYQRIAREFPGDRALAAKSLEIGRASCRERV